jgi:transposase-like protein
MRKERRTFQASFKAKIAIEAIKEQLTVNELAQKHQLHPNQIATWKKEFLAKADTVFDNGKAHQEELESLRNRQSELYREIGELKMDRDWLKKKLQ